MARLFSKDDSDIEVAISTHSIVRAIIAVCIAFILALAISKSAHTLTLIGIAFFLALALNAPVHWLSEHIPGRQRGSRTLATFISILLILAVLVGFIMAFVPPLTKQTTKFIQNVPQIVNDTRSGEGPIGTFVETYNLEGQVETISEKLSERVDNLSLTAIDTAARIGGSIVSVLTVLVLTVMMLLEGPRWSKLFAQFVPVRHKKRVVRLVADMNKVIQGFVNGQVTLAAIAATLILPVFLIMDVDYAIALTVIVFICGLIPMVGHIIGATIVTTVALFQSVPAAIVVLAYYILYQQIENYVVQPRVQANTTSMSPLLVFLSVIIGINFGGLLGGLVAIPVAGCLRILVLDYLARREILTSPEEKVTKVSN